jgi:hypothetical protein
MVKRKIKFGKNVIGKELLLSSCIEVKFVGKVAALQDCRMKTNDDVDNAQKRTWLD